MNRAVTPFAIALFCTASTATAGSYECDNAMNSYRIELRSSRCSEAEAYRLKAVAAQACGARTPEFTYKETTVRHSSGKTTTITRGALCPNTK